MSQSETSKPVGSDRKGKAPGGWWAEVKGFLWVILAVLGLHTFIAKPFYIPSESMMPTLLKGDHLLVSKFPYGWSWVSPTFHVLPHMKGRVFGRTPERGDIVIVTPPGETKDLIKRVIGLPGDEIEVIGGNVIINGKAIVRQKRAAAMIPIDPNIACEPQTSGGERIEGRDGKLYCRLPIVRETLPNGRSYDTIDLGYYPQIDDFPKIKVPPGHLFLMGDNRDRSADSRVPLEALGLGGPVPIENIGGRAEFITHSLDGSSQYLNPLTWFTALRGGRAGSSLHPQDGGGR